MSRQLLPRAAKTKATEALAQMERDNEDVDVISVATKPCKDTNDYKFTIPEVKWDESGSYVAPSATFATPISSQVRANILKEYRAAMSGAKMNSIVCAVCSR